MKKTALSLIALFAALQFSYAQWTTSGSNIYNSNTGNVGIGTTTPAGKFQVYNGNYDFLISPYSVDIGLGGTSGGWARAIRIVNSSGSNGTDGGALGVLGSGSTPSYVYMAIPTSDPTGYNSSKILSLNNSGNVGIGTTNPLGTFHVRSGTNKNLLVRASSTDGVTIYSVNDANSDVKNMEFGALKYNFAGGNVGIGTDDTKGYKLAVNGAAVATSVKVKLQANWPDFVFLKGYKLPTLTEVKTYIDKNQHLPDMPSADEVHTNGLDLGEMNRLLLKKVEELTLYLIEKDSQIAEQRSKEEKQEERLAALELALKKLIAEK